jgi:hypothetical protein
MGNTAAVCEGSLRVACSHRCSGMAEIDDPILCRHGVPWQYSRRASYPSRAPGARFFPERRVSHMFRHAGRQHEGGLTAASLLMPE